MEGKYWKRRAEAVIAEYKKWRKFHIMRLLGKGDTSVQDTVGLPVYNWFCSNNNVGSSKSAKKKNSERRSVPAIVLDFLRPKVPLWYVTILFAIFKHFLQLL